VKPFIIIFSLLWLAGCVSQSPTKTPPPKSPPVAEAPVAKVYTLEAPVLPKPEIVESPDAEPEQPDTQGPPAPKVLLGHTREGVPVYLSDFRGKLVLVNYWASWCPPCWAEMAQLEAIYSDFRHRGVSIVAVNQGESEQAIENFLRGQLRPISFLIATDPNSTLSHEQDVRAVPTTLLFDTDGKQIKRYTGVFGFQPDQVRGDLARLLERAGL